MNKVILMGRFTRDPEQRMSQTTNVEVSRFSLACQGERLNRSTGETDVEFINCVAFGQTANLINRFCNKGRQILVQGRIRNNSYTAQDGTKRYSTDVIVDNFEFIGSKGTNDSGASYSNTAAYTPEESTPNVEPTDVSQDPYKDFGDEYTLSSDDLPF